MARRDGESIHRRILVRMWGDEKVRKLSKPAPNGQTLWVHLLAGEQTGIIPGICRIGEAAFAEQLEWDIEGFRHAFREVSDQGMAKADWKARLIFVPKAIHHNPPASLNVVASWRTAWDLLPECDLKEEARRYIKDFLQGMGEAWAKAFDKACPKPRANQVTGNSEQVTGKEEAGRPPQKAAAPAPPAAAPAASPLVSAINSEWPDLAATPEAVVAWEKAFAGVDLVAETRQARAHWASNGANRKPGDFPTAFLNRWFKNAKNGPPAGLSRGGSGSRAPPRPSGIPAASPDQFEKAKLAQQAKIAGGRTP